MKPSIGTCSMGDAIHVRMYRDTDLPAVLDLLRAGLGESPLLKRTPDLFRWKHVDNPFGRSVLLVAEADESIVGLRAFMRWQLDFEGGVISCGRAVDTATHPAYQRRGIFKRLTMAALDVARDVGIQLIFNTPNERSRPGYLKMGWSDVGPIRVMVRPHPTRMPRRAATSFPTIEALAPGAAAISPGGSGVVGIHDRGTESVVVHGLRTPRSVEYMEWRFAGHPTARYAEVVRPAGAAVLRANLRKGRSELVISDALGPEPAEAVRAAVRGSKADYDVASFPRRSAGRRAARRAGMLSVPGVAALRLVAHPLETLDVDVLDPRSWRLALSDLELL
jgi:GNAT superfamily N-acetyltransferase